MDSLSNWWKINLTSPPSFIMLEKESESLLKISSQKGALLGSCFILKKERKKTFGNILVNSLKKLNCELRSKIVIIEPTIVIWDPSKFMNCNPKI